MTSVPRTTSARRGERSSSPAKHNAGRRLANTPNSRRSRNSPLSGRRWLGNLSNAGPPTAPSNTAPEARQACERIRGQRILVGKKGRAPDRLACDVELMAEDFSDRFQYADGFVGNFRSDAVAGKSGDIQEHGLSIVWRTIRHRKNALSS